MPTTFTLHEVAGGVFAAIAPGTSGPAVSNTAIVDLGDKTLVVDTFMTGLAAEELAGEAQRLTGRAPFLVVNSHWHSDHVGGNQAFAGTPIAGTERMRELIVEDAPKTEQEHRSRLDAIRQSADALVAAAQTPEETARADGTRALADALAAEERTKRLTLPDLLIGDRLEIVGNQRSAVVLGLGRGHTESDLFVHVPDAGVVIAGDLVWTGMHPKTSDGFPADWIGVLDAMSGLEPGIVVSGHGPPGSAEDVSAMAAYLGAVAEMVEVGRAGDLAVDDAAPPPGSEDWQDASRFHAGLGALIARNGW